MEIEDIKRLDEVTVRELPGVRRTHGNAFELSVWEVVVGCQLLRPVIDRLDSMGVEHFARQATTMWMAAHAAHGRMASTPDGAADERVKALLEGRTTLIELFADAKNKIEVPRMYAALDELGALLSGAAVEAPDNLPRRS